MKRTPLYDVHASLGARIVDFAGWEMPIQYTSILEEHRAVRERAGLFDVSHMGDIIIQGEGAEEQLRGLLTNDIKDLPVGKGIYAHMLDESGRILDDTITFHVLPGTYLLIPNASTVDRIYDWVKSRVRAEVINVSERIASVALQGPQANAILQKLTDIDLSALKRMRGAMMTLRVPGVPEGGRAFLPDVLGLPAPSDGVQAYVTRSGYTGEDGFEILVEGEAAVPLWNALAEAGGPEGLRPSGLGARDLLRLEMGYLLSGTDFDGSQTPLETGPEWVVKWNHQFIGREALLDLRERGMFRRLVGLELQTKGIPRHGYPIRFQGREVGRVTSGTLSPILNRGIALGYVNLNHAKEGEVLEIGIRDSSVEARVVAPPFIGKR